MPLKNKSGAFTILELMLSMMIFTIMGLTLYSMMDALTRLQSTSLGLQRYMNEGHNMLDKLGTEISLATTEPVYLVDPMDTSIRKSFIPEFVCTKRNEAVTGDPLFFPGEGVKPALPYVQQLYFTVIDHSLSIEDSTSSGVLAIEKFLKDMKSNLNWNKVFVKECIFYLSTEYQIWFYGRKEKNNSNNKVDNKVDGVADINLDGGYNSVPAAPFFDSKIYHIEYLFWGNKSKGWEDDGVSGQPIRSWDSRSLVTDIHKAGELPRAMKILLTLNYNPEIYDRREEHLDSDKNQLITLERVVVFKNYKNLEGA